MSTHHGLVEALVDKNKISMQSLLHIEDKAWELLKKADECAYDELILELEKRYYTISLDEARQIVSAMMPFGEVWTYDKISQYLQTKGICDKCLDYYLVMNMVRNDYFDTAKKFNLQDNTDFYFHLAQDFIEDEDAKEYKVEKYFM